MLHFFCKAKDVGTGSYKCALFCHLQDKKNIGALFHVFICNAIKAVFLIVHKQLIRDLNYSQGTQIFTETSRSV